jgi:hypothetical protein
MSSEDSINNFTSFFDANQFYDAYSDLNTVNFKIDYENSDVISIDSIPEANIIERYIIYIII